MKWIVFGIVGIIISFFLVVLGLMKMFPLYVATPLLFVTIFYTISRLFHRTSFKGFKSMQ